MSQENVEVVRAMNEAFDEGAMRRQGFSDPAEALEAAGLAE